MGQTGALAGTIPTAATVSLRPALTLAGEPTLSLNAQAYDRGSVGFELVQPLVAGKSTLLLGEVYGFKGDTALGGIGAGAIARHAVGGGFLEGNVFFDALQDERGFAYPQLGAGIAFDRGWYAVRANGYLPLTGAEKRRSGSDRRKDVSGSLLAGRVDTVDLAQDRFETSSPMRGFEVEAEIGLPQPPTWIDPRLVVGYYHQEAEDSPKVYSGLKVRGEVHLAEHWTAEVEWRSDAGDLDQEWRFAIRGQWTFGTGSKTSNRDADGIFAARMYQRAVRQPWPTIARSNERGAEYVTSRHTKLAPTLHADEPGCDCGKPLVFE